MVDAGWHKISAAAAVIAGLLGLQRLVGVHATGEAKLLISHVLSLALCAAVMELGSPVVGLRFIKPSSTAIAMRPARVYAFLTLLLVVSAFSRETAPFFALLPSPPPTLSLTILVCFWAALLVWVACKGHSNVSMAFAVVGLVVGTRILMMGIWPFQRLDGDMLATIDLGLDELIAGRFPHVDFPPPMPYLPGTFLAYLPAKLLGLDLRWTNLVLDAAAVVATLHLARRLADRGRTGPAAGADARPLLNQLLLPCLMLHPVWIQYCVNTQYSPCLLLTLLLGFAVLFENHKAQAVALGLAVGSNQMLGACGPILFAHWLGRVGPRRAAGLALLAVAVFLLVIAPFLLWNPGRFIEVAFLSRNRFDDALMAGRFTLLPLASRLVPRADLIGSAVVLAMASWVVLGSRRASTTVAAMAAGLCAALMFQPVSFAHYFLPAIVLASVTPLKPSRDGQRAAIRAPLSRRAARIAARAEESAAA